MILGICEFTAGRSWVAMKLCSLRDWVSCCRIWQLSRLTSISNDWPLSLLYGIPLMSSQFTQSYTFNMRDQLLVINFLWQKYFFWKFVFFVLLDVAARNEDFSWLVRTTVLFGCLLLHYTAVSVRCDLMTRAKMLTNRSLVSVWYTTLVASLWHPWFMFNSKGKISSTKTTLN